MDTPKFLYAPLLSACLALTSCGHPPMITARLDEEKSLGANEAILVVGNRSDANLVWGRVSVTDGIATPIPKFNEQYLFDGDNSDFSVWKIGDLAQRPTLGIVYYRVGGIPYKPCGEALMPVVTLSPGELVYVGNHDYKVESAIVKINWHSSLEGAAIAVRNAYPDVHATLVERPLEFYKSSETCDPLDIRIPVYLPRRR